MASQAKAQDLLTLILGVPLLGLSMVYASKNSLRGKLFLLGTLGYFLYSYTSYVFLAQYNQLFIVYIALTSLTFFAFIMCFQSFDVAQVKAAFSGTFPRRRVAISLLVFAFMMSFRALAMILPSVFANIIPAELEHYTSLVIQALDLTVLLPTTVIAGILLLKNHPLGYFLTTIVVVKMSTLGLAVLTMLAFMAAAGLPVILSEVILFTVVSIFLLLLLYTTFKHIKKGK
ncbi:hypothetical protein BAU15_11860 [Enterococcus sp. JM4C]|nr:hypothetical protein BAU15_11860 [Enterococcus sp. JM4C]